MQQPAIIEMKESYPFGQLKEVSQSEGVALVRKKLIFNSPAQLQIIKKMVSLLETLKHPQLIQLQSYELAGEDKFYFYYEYVPLTLEKWILDLGDDILDDLQSQMISIARFLAKQDIKFHFDPDCLGLSKDIKVKYFLQQFMIDSENQNEYYEQVVEEIGSFFKQFRLAHAHNDETSTNFSQRKSADSALLGKLGVLNDRGSWESGARHLANERTKKSILLSEKVECSKKKSMQILMRLKAMKPKSQQ